MRVMEVSKFTNEAREALRQEGYLLYALTGQSIRSLREAGRPFWSIWHQDYPDFENLPSRLSEVAIDPDPTKFFLPKSNNKTLKQQIGMIVDFSEQLTKRIAGVRALMGEAPDYTELAFLRLDATGERLFGEKYDYRFTRTQTSTVGPLVAYVGGFYADHGLRVSDWNRDHSDRRLWAAPLVVPA